MRFSPNTNKSTHAPALRTFSMLSLSKASFDCSSEMSWISCFAFSTFSFVPEMVISSLFLSWRARDSDNVSIFAGRPGKKGGWVGAYACVHTRARENWKKNKEPRYCERRDFFLPVAVVEFWCLSYFPDRPDSSLLSRGWSDDAPEKNDCNFTKNSNS